MYINTYNLTGQALIDASYHNDRERSCDLASRRRNEPWRRDVRRLAAYLAIRLGPEWLNADEYLLASYLPLNYSNLPHHELIAHLDGQGITPEHCTLA